MIKNSNDKYMYLNTIKEIITNKPESLQNYIGELMPLYISQANNQDEKIRNIVSESIGKLFIKHPNQIVEPLRKAMLNSDELTVATCASSFKFSAHKNQNPQFFVPFVDVLISMIGQDNIEIKKNCLVSLMSIAFNPKLKPCLKDKLAALVQIVLPQTIQRKDYITTVDLGPFKHTIDKGEPIRKAAYSLLETISESFSFNQIDVVDTTIQGLADPCIDIQQQCLALLFKLIAICPSHVISRLDNVIERFSTLYQKNSNNLKKADEAERATNLMRGVLKICAVLFHYQEATQNQNFTQWVQTYVNDNSEVPVMHQLFQKASNNLEI